MRVWVETTGKCILCVITSDDFCAVTSPWWIMTGYTLSLNASGSYGQ